MSWESEFEKEYRIEVGGETYNESHEYYYHKYVEWLEERLTKALKN
jgi:hypothetical protein